MKKSKTKKILKLTLILFLTVIILLSFQNLCIGASSGKIDTSKIDINPSGDLVSLGKIILGTVRVIGTAISVVIIAVIGIKYMMASVEEKAEYKQTFGYYLMGAILLFSGTTIIDVLYNALR